MPYSNMDLEYMAVAIEEAKAAAKQGDVPVGAVLVCDGHIIAQAHNTKETLGSAIGHAEINAITEACNRLGRWRLTDCTLYVTLEPCPMCTGAILSARIPRVVVGTKDAVAGAMGSIWALHKDPAPMGTCDVSYGCMEEECRQLLQAFFKERRKEAEEIVK